MATKKRERSRDIKQTETKETSKNKKENDLFIVVLSKNEEILNELTQKILKPK